jgi:hypothetical protein
MYNPDARRREAKDQARNFDVLHKIIPSRFASLWINTLDVACPKKVIAT